MLRCLPMLSMSDGRWAMGDLLVAAGADEMVMVIGSLGS